MDIGTKKEPGRELNLDEVRGIGGGYIAPDPEDPTQPPSPDDPFGGGDATPPVDYATP